MTTRQQRRQAERQAKKEARKKGNGHYPKKKSCHDLSPPIEPKSASRIKRDFAAFAMLPHIV